MKKQIAFAIARHALTILGGVLVSRGTLDNAAVEVLIGAIMSILGVAWSLAHKQNNEHIQLGEDQNWIGGPADKSDRGGPGNRGVIGLLLCLSVLSASVVQLRAEEAPALTTETRSHGEAPAFQPFSFSAFAKIALDYVAEHGEVGTGYGLALDGNLPGVLLTQRLDIYRWQIRRSQIGLGVAHATLFTFADSDPDLSLVGISASWHWFKSPPWVGEVQSLPVIRNLLFLRFTEVKLSPFIGVEAEDLIKGQFHWRRTVAGAAVTFKF
jgi:hypothetical protein